jgi:hypothetical protein
LSSSSQYRQDNQPDYYSIFHLNKFLLTFYKSNNKTRENQPLFELQKKTLLNLKKYLNNFSANSIVGIYLPVALARRGGFNTGFIVGFSSPTKPCLMAVVFYFLYALGNI